MHDARRILTDAAASPHGVVARFAHDAASPLMIVLNLTELAAAGPGVSDKMRTDLLEIRDAGRHLLELIEELHERSTKWTAG